SPWWPSSSSGGTVAGCDPERRTATSPGNGNGRRLWPPRRARDGIGQNAATVRVSDLRGGREAVDLRLCRSRLWESNPRPTHYEGRPHYPLPSLPAALLQHRSLGDAPAA